MTPIEHLAHIERTMSDLAHRLALLGAHGFAADQSALAAQIATVRRTVEAQQSVADLPANVIPLHRGARLFAVGGAA